jgi:uncharacterized protein (DUF1015 family)
MTVVRPFRAVRYDPSRVDLSRVIVPPYDVISGDERGAFFDRDPHNAIRFELTRDVADEASTDYAHIREELDAWRESGVLLQDAEPAFYVMRQRFQAPDGRQLERVGFFAELELAEYQEGVVLPHENTLAGPVEDRLRLLRAARANLSSVFMLYEDRDEVLSRIFTAALEGNVLGVAVDDAGVEYTLAAITRADDVEAIRSFLDARPVVIADGHHRYETALAYRSQNGGDAASEAGAGSTLAYFANLYAKGSLLLPIHRVVLRGTAPSEADYDAKLPGWKQESLEVDPDGVNIPALLEANLTPRAGQPAFAADDGSGTLRIFWRDESLGDELMVRILERDVLGAVFGLAADDIREGAVSFPKSSPRAAEAVRGGDGVVALYLNPLDPDDVFRVTRAGERMPQKSTFFSPKVPTGMVFRLHEHESHDSEELQEQAEGSASN